MLDDPSSRRGLTPVRHYGSWSKHAADRLPRQRLWRRVAFSLALGMVLFMQVFGNATVVAAAPKPPVHLPAAQGKLTFQQFLQQSHPYAAFDGLHVAPTSPQALPLRSTNTMVKTTASPQSSLPSAEPATMKAVSQTLSTAFLNATAAPSDLSPSITGSSSVPAVHLIGNDANGVRMEVEIPAGALDLSAAKTVQGTAPQGTLSVTLTQIRGHFAGSTTDLGTFQLQFTDGQGQVLQGMRLRVPIVLIFHYRPQELERLGVDPRRLALFWPGAQTTTTTATSSATTTQSSTKDALLPMTQDSPSSTLSVQSSVLSASPLVVTGGTNPIQAPPKPNVAGVQGNGGQLGYSYPLVVAPGPLGTVPQLAVNYSSANTNARHEPTTPADSAGEGWSLTMGAISAEKYPDGTTWYSISGVDNISDRLVPDSNGDDWLPEHLAYLKVSKVTGSNGQSCFDVWDPSGNFYEFGCTADSLQYYNKSSTGQTNYRWDLDRMQPVNEGPGTDNRVMTLSYIQDIESESGNSSVRDAALKQITYGTKTTTAGTVDFFYNGPSNQSPWETQYSSSYESACKLPATPGQPERCDDPIDRGSASDPAVMSTLSLQTVKTYVGNDSSTSHLDYSYSFSYQDTAFGSCPSADTTLSSYYCAGDHLLTSITPTVYQNGSSHQLPAVTFGYTGRILGSKYTRINKYDDKSQSYHMENSWNYLTSYHDHRTGVGASTITYHSAYNNSHGTPYSSGDQDNRYDALYCVWHPDDCNSGTSFYPMDDKMWTQQVVTQIVGVGTDSSSSSLKPDQVSYDYWLTKTQGSCPADSQGNSDCVGDGWIPKSNDTASYQDYYHGEFKGFGTVLITNSAGDLTVQKYATTWGWDSSESDPRNYLAGSLLEEDAYQGGKVNQSHLIEQTVNTYAGQNSTPNSCSTKYNSTVYDACEVILTSSKSTLYEQTGNAGPWVQHAYTYDDYRSTCGQTSCLGDNHQSPATGSYHNLQQEVTTSSNAPTVTQNWTYDTTNTTVNGHVYYNVNQVASSNLVDANNHTWQCQSTTYDEGVASGIPQPAAGWPTTETTASNCANQSGTAIKGYSGYDANGNAVATVDGVEASNSSVYSGVGCTLSTAPQFFSTSNWGGSHYTSCAAYDGTSALPTDSWNALGHHSTISYDATQGLVPVSTTDINGQTATSAYSYDSSGNLTTKVSEPGETSSYSSEDTQKTTCTDSSTLPCVEVDSDDSLYSGAVARTFYDSQGRAVEMLEPGPDSSHTTVTFTVYNDAARSVFTSLPFRVATRTTWLDPNTATDETGQSPKGSEADSDAIGRVVKAIDALSNTSTVAYSMGTSGVSGDSNTYAITTSVDANNHVGVSYTDALRRTIYTVLESGTNGGTVTPNQRKTFQYNALNEPTTVTVTDLVPQSGQSVTSVTATAQYDDLGRVTSVNDPDKGSSTYSYDADSRTLTVVNGSRTIGTSYDVLGRAGCLQDAAPTADPNGACTSGAHPFVQNTYDVDPNGISWGSTNYAKGELTQSVSTTYFPDPDNTQGTVTENMQYDARGRLTTKRMQIATSGGSLAFPTFPQYQVALSYNDDDQPTTTTTTVGGQTGYTFTQSYDSTLGLLNGLSNTTTAAPTLVSLAYNEMHGLLSDLTYKDSSGANLATEHLSYDGLLRPSSKTTTWQSDSSAIYSDSVGYDNVGNVLSRATTQAAVPGVTGSGGNETQNFCYDEQSRMVWASNSVAATPGSSQTCGSATLQGTLGSGYTTSDVYTHLGQIWQGALNGSGTQEQYLYCNSSHPHQVTALSPASGNPSCSASGTPDYSGTYDTWGNLITRSYNANNSSLSYDALDEMVRWNGMTSTSSQEEWYLYDAAGDRVLRRSATTGTSGNPATSPATITVYAFGLEEHVYSYSGSGSSLSNTGNTYYYSLGGRLIGTLSGSSTPSTSFMLTDTLGSVVTTISNTAGSAQVLGTQLYGPYGNKRSSSGTMGTAKGYTGQYNDDVTGLDYYNARYYDPVIARFLSADDVQGNLSGMDPYDYVGGNPETDTDPTGQMLIDGGVGNYWSNQYQLGRTAATLGQAQSLPIAITRYLPSSSGGSRSVSKPAPRPGTSLSKVLKTALQSQGHKASGQQQRNGGNPYSSLLKKKNVGFDNNQDPACSGSKSIGDCPGISLLAVQSHHTQISVPMPGGFSATIDVSTVSVSPLTSCPNLAACFGDPGSGEEGIAIGEEAQAGEVSVSEACSFTSQTTVATDQGKHPISKLHPGEQVWAYNPKTHKMEVQPILHVWVHQDDDLVDLTITPVKATSHDGKAEQTKGELIHTNKKHPFLTIEKGFLPVGQIKIGMHVVRADGSIGVITGWMLLPGVKTMYNLEVAQDHTFTVGDEQWVVHNCAMPENPNAYIKPGAYQNGVKKLGSNIIHDEFISKMDNGIVSGKNAQGIKVLNTEGPNGQFYQYELKSLATKAANWRFYGNWDEDLQHIVFDYFGRALH
jgi:RHS repeat-associated protein